MSRGENTDKAKMGRVSKESMGQDNRTLVSDPQYKGKYVALVSCNDNTIVGSGKSRQKARNIAKKQGHDMPFVLYVPAGAGAHCINAHR